MKLCAHLAHSCINCVYAIIEGRNRRRVRILSYKKVMNRKNFIFGKHSFQFAKQEVSQ